jgi:CheY-like chemotaxis protein
VLLVEDDADIALGLRYLLEDQGYRVEIATNGREALDLLSHIPRPAVTLVDLMMPVMDGWQLLRAIKANRTLASLPIAITSAVADSAPNGYRIFKKPLDLSALLQFVSQTCPA